MQTKTFLIIRELRNLGVRGVIPFYGGVYGFDGGGSLMLGGLNIRKYATCPIRGVKVYSDLISDISDIYKDNKGKSGIYL